MTDPFATALGALFSAPGSVAATYTSIGGQPVPLRVIWAQGSADGGSRSDRTVLDTNMFDIMRSDVETPLRGAIIAFADPRSGASLKFKINGAPILDVEGISWACPAEPA